MEQPQRLHCAHTPSHLLEPRDHPLTARLLHRALDVGRQAEEGRGISLGQLRDQLYIVLAVGRGGDHHLGAREGAHL